MGTFDWAGFDDRPTTMVLLGLLVGEGCRRWLHREDYVFEDKVNSLTLGRVALGHRSRNARHGIRFTPAQWFFLGFKDRNLEDDYLNDFIIISRRQIILGYSRCILVYKKDRFRNKRMVLHITEGVFLLFIVLMAN